MDQEELERQKNLKKLEVLLEQRNIIAAAEADTQKSHDQAILTLSSAAIGLSLTLKPKVLHPPSACALYGSWILFVVAIICTLFSFRANVAALRRQADNFDDALANIGLATQPKPTHGERGAVLSNGASFAFVFGIILLLIFAIAQV
jgi:hypothetical protein